MRVKLAISLALILPAVCSLLGTSASMQTGAGHTLYGDLTVDEGHVEGLKPMSFDIILYTDGGRVVGRQTVTSRGRYRFTSVPNGNYDVVVELENQEVARVHFSVSSSFKNDFRQDVALKWQPSRISSPGEKTKVVSAADTYVRPQANTALFEKSAEAMEKQDYEQAITFLRRIVEIDPNDFLSWTELGTAYLGQKNSSEAERAYTKALELRPKFFLALMNLGRLRIAEENYDGAITSLAAAVEVQPYSAIANYYLGQAYLQIKKGSKAVGYLYEALRLEPVKMADAHLLLAVLYNGAGLKDKAATEYGEFLKKRPDYKDRKKLEKYIADNRK
jgi:tetratricopeptide (TPR) repeat protein